MPWITAALCPLVFLLPSGSVHWGSPVIISLWLLGCEYVGEMWGEKQFHSYDRSQKDSYLILMKMPLSTLSHVQQWARMWGYLPWGHGCVFCVGRREPRVPKEATIIFAQPKSHKLPTFHKFPGHSLRHLTCAGQYTGRGRKDSGARKSPCDSFTSLSPCP